MKCQDCKYHSKCEEMCNKGLCPNIDEEFFQLKKEN